MDHNSTADDMRSVDELLKPMLIAASMAAEQLTPPTSAGSAAPKTAPSAEKPRRVSRILDFAVDSSESAPPVGVPEVAANTGSDSVALPSIKTLFDAAIAGEGPPCRASAGPSMPAPCRTPPRQPTAAPYAPPVYAFPPGYAPHPHGVSAAHYAPGYPAPPGRVPIHPAGYAPQVLPQSAMQRTFRLVPAPNGGPVLAPAGGAAALHAVGAAQGAHVRRCANCGTKDTPSWRRVGPEQTILCNACGLYFMEHNEHRVFRVGADGRTRAMRRSKNRHTRRGP